MTEPILIPASRYVSPEFAALERARVFERAWLLVGPRSLLAEPGMFRVLDVGAESLLVVRADDGFAAFYNVCRHRGAQLVDAPCGKAASFRCRYHAFVYGLDGVCTSAPIADRFPGGSPVGSVRLAPVRCEERHGFVWLSMAEAPDPLDAFIAPIASHLARIDAALALQSDTVVELPCNWKTSVDVHNEAYHLRTLHAELAGYVDHDGVTLEPLGDHSKMTIPLRAGGHKEQLHVFPNVQLNVSPGRLEMYRHRPHATDSGQSYFDELSFGSGAARPVAPRRMRLGEGSLGSVTDQDLALLPLLARGVRSRGLGAMRLGPEEGAIAHFHDVLGRWTETA